MANTRELRRRIKSVKNTAQITRAMQMVAATKMRRAQIQALAGRPYSLTLDESLKKLIPSMHPEAHPLLNPNDSKETAVIVLSTDKSLCGALNTNLFRSIQANFKEGSNFIFYTVGKKGREFIVRTERKLEADFENPELVTFREASQIAKIAIDSYIKGEVKEVYVAYPQFISTLRQEPKIMKLLPIDPLELSASLESSETEKKTAKTEVTSEFLFEPDLDELLEYVLNHFLEVKVFSALLETKASEWSARMMAMQNATDNAKDLVEDLNLSYNQTRQNAITQELLEITTAGLALE